MQLQLGKQQLDNKVDVLLVTNEHTMSIKVFPLQFFGIKNFPLKKKLFFTVTLIGLCYLSAQDKNNLALRIEPGILLKTDSENLGLLLNLEPHIKIGESGVIGLRFGLALNSQKFLEANNSQFNIAENNDHAVISFLPTFDYYLNKSKNQPYLGIGLGYYLLSQITLSNPSEEGSVDNQVGLLLRGGLKLRRTRLGLEYNVIPKADIEIPDGQIVGTVESSYLGFSIAFIIGGEKTLKTNNDY